MAHPQVVQLHLFDFGIHFDAETELWYLTYTLGDTTSKLIIGDDDEFMSLLARLPSTTSRWT